MFSFLAYYRHGFQENIVKNSLVVVPFCFYSYVKREHFLKNKMILILKMKLTNRIQDLYKISDSAQQKTSMAAIPFIKI